MSCHSPIRFIPETERNKTPCYICGKRDSHPYWDPESNGSICHEDIGAMLLAEVILTATPGLIRPHVSTDGQKGQKKHKTSRRRKAKPNSP